MTVKNTVQHYWIKEEKGIEMGDDYSLMNAEYLPEIRRIR